MIEVQGLVRDYEGIRALDGVSFAVGAGEVFGFIGPNGAGKTTTIRILATLLEPTEGRAAIGGHDVVHEPEQVRAMIGYMPDTFGVYDGVTVREYLDFFAAAHRVPRRERRRVIEQVMDLTDLGGLRDRGVAELSKGVRQRLGLARTLVHDPAVLLQLRSITPTTLLVCSCNSKPPRPPKPCHGDIVASAWQWLKNTGQL